MAVAAAKPMLMVGFLIEEFIEDMLWASSMLQQMMGKFSKQGAVRADLPFASVFVTGAGWDGERYLVDLEFNFIEPWKIRAALLTTKPLTALTGKFNVTVDIPHADRAVTFDLDNATEVRSVRLRLPGKWTILTATINVDGTIWKANIELPASLWAEMERHRVALEALALVNKATELRRAAEDELKALERLWERWLDDKEPTCELMPEIQARFRAYTTAAKEWEKAFKEARDYIYRHLPDVKPPKESRSLPVVLPPEQWPERSALNARINALASQAESIVNSVMPDINYVIEKSDTVQKEIESIANDATADMIKARQRGEPEERIKAIRAAAIAAIKERRSAYAKEIAAAKRKLQNAIGQVMQIAETAKYLLCQGAKPQEYLIETTGKVTPA